MANFGQSLLLNIWTPVCFIETSNITVKRGQLISFVNTVKHLQLECQSISLEIMLHNDNK